MTPEQVSELVLALAAGCALASFAGCMAWGFLRDLAGQLARWALKRAKPPTPYQLNLVARGLRQRADQLERKAEKLRAG